MNTLFCDQLNHVQIQTLNTIEAALAWPEMEKEAGLQIKVQAHEKTEARANPAKAQAAADAPPLTEETELMPSKVAAEAMTGAEAKAADKALASGKASNHASITAASMLAQICERAFMEHQLAARHFTFYHFCEHAPILCVCVCLCPLAALTALTAPH